MTDTSSPEAAGLDVRRRKLLFRCWHRGTREMDLLLGRYADRYMCELSDDDVASLENLLEAPDTDLFGWITGEKAVPANFDLPILHAIRAFHRDSPVADTL